MNPIKKRIVEFLKGERTLPAEQYLSLIEEAKSFIELGIEADADAIIYASKISGEISVVALVGRSLVQAGDLYSYLEAYFSDSGEFDIHALKIANYIYEDIKMQSDCGMVLKSADNKWRSFNPLKNIDEVLQGVAH